MSKWFTSFQCERIRGKRSQIKKVYEDYDNSTIRTEDDDYVYYENIVYKITKAIDLNDNALQIKDKEIVRRVKNSTPKHKSIFSKIIGEIMIGVGELAAPFSMGASLVGVGGGITIIASSK